MYRMIPIFSKIMSACRRLLSFLIINSPSKRRGVGAFPSRFVDRNRKLFEKFYKFQTCAPNETTPDIEIISSRNRSARASIFRLPPLTLFSFFPLIHSFTFVFSFSVFLCHSLSHSLSYVRAFYNNIFFYNSKYFYMQQLPHFL